MKDLTVNVHHITRVEGHGNIVLDVKEGTIEKLELQIVEAPRFFEAMLRGRRYDEAQHLTCRICGICSGAHTCASLTGMEAALGVTPSEQTVLLRKLITNAEQLESHFLHFYYLVAPDFFNVGSVIPLAESHPEAVKRALKLKRLANHIFEVIGGRHVHMCSAVINGFTYIPSAGELREIKDRLEESWDDVWATVDLAASLELPDFERETEYISIKHPDEYAFYQGDLVSSDRPEPTLPNDYLDRIEEYLVDHSTSKFARSSRDDYMVGALARFNNNYDQLHDSAKKAADKIGLKAPFYNPFAISIAQVIEAVHCTEDAIQTIDKLLTSGLKQEDRSFPVKGGKGAGIVEAPRGTLIHEYEVGDDGFITGANLIIPTNQNFGSMEADLRALVPQIIDRPKEEISKLMQMLVRAYDPCISCSCHTIKVDFIE